MNYYMDWNCRLLPGMRGRISDPLESITAMQDLSERFSITRFCMMPDFDCTREPVSHFFLRRARAEKLLKDAIPTGSKIKVKISARVLLSQGLYQTEDLNKLVITKEKYLPIALPMTAYDDWIDYELNRLLYKAGFKKLLITSFELCLILYPSEIIEKLLRIPNTVFQINYKALTEPKVQKIVSRLMRQNQTILLGTSLDCLERVYRYDFDFYTKSATDGISVADYKTMLRKSCYFWNK